MLAKFIIITLAVGVLLLQMAACENDCPIWVKLNTDPVCFGARGNQHGTFINSQDISVSHFMLIHKSGKVSAGKGVYSYWGSPPNAPALGVLLTNQQNTILAPDASVVSRNGWYRVTGYTSSSTVLVLCRGDIQDLQAGEELRLWYGEDLSGFTEWDNKGKTCADVYARKA